MSTKWNWAGSRWWKFDFHSHTPASIDYGKGEKQTEYQSISPRDWLLNYMRAKIDCVAITDHNSGAWVDPLKDALEELKTDMPDDYRPLYIFPAVEITVQGNIHILAILPQDKTTSDIDSLLGAVGYRNTKGDSDGCTESSAAIVIDEIAKFGGIAIPAHVDQGSGLFQLSGNTLSQILDSKNIFAMEVVNPANEKPQLYFEKKLSWSEVLGSDAHHPEGNEGEKYPGSHYTWVKMSQPSLEGLRLALIDGNLSLLRSDEFDDNPNQYSPLVIEAIEIDNAKYLGRGTPITFQMNPWLNTIIGGRGTGKSTSLEFLRIALQRISELPKTLNDEFYKYKDISLNRKDDGLLTNSTVITVFYRKDGSRFRISWQSSNQEYRIEEDQSGSWVQSEGNISQRFPIRIYSQKQIFELAKHTKALLKIIDDSPDVKYHDWKLKWDELLTEFFSLQAKIRALASGINEEAVFKGRLEDTIRKLAVFESTGHAGILKEYQLRQNQDKALLDWENSWKSTALHVRSLAQKIIPPSIDTNYISDESNEGKELLHVTSALENAFSAISDKLNSVAEEIDGIQQAWNEQKVSLEITDKIKESRQAYTDLLEKLASEGAGDPSAYAHLVNERQQIEEKLQEFEKKRKELSILQDSAAKHLEEIYRHRGALTRHRETFLENTLSDNNFVKIEVVAFGDDGQNIEDEFRRLINRIDGGFERDIGSIKDEEGVLSIFSKSGLTIEEKIEGVKKYIFDIYNHEADAIEKAKDKRFVSHIQSLTPDQLDRIQCWFPEDSLDVQYSLKGTGQFKPIDQGSPGQKTAALLAFILSYGEEPLILDQPEDDLDNHLIYDLIVTQLRDIKQHRQILIVTHNANIVVNGDAENIVVLDIVSGRTQIIAQAGLQETHIRDEICRIMEGGKDAFEQRYKRITAG